MERPKLVKKYKPAITYEKLSKTVSKQFLNLRNDLNPENWAIS
jgi:hypothetical protein